MSDAATDTVRSPPVPKHEQSESPNESSEHPQSAPSATPAAQKGNEQPRPGSTVCQNCLTTTTPLWRRDENGQILCNACGLFLKLHGRRRPISLKTDVIKSRNRSRHGALPRRNTSSATKRQRLANLAHAHEKNKRESEMRKAASSDSRSRGTSPDTRSVSPSSGANTPLTGPEQGSYLPKLSPLPASQPLIQPPQQYPPPAGGYALRPRMPGSLPTYEFPQQPTPVRTPVTTQQGNANQSQFLQTLPSVKSPALPSDSSNSPPNIHMVRGSMSELLLPRSPPEGLERVPPLQHIKAAELRSKQPAPSAPVKSEPKSTEEVNKELNTRVSELELVNDLLKRRIADLEYSESQARRVAVDAQQTVENLWKQLTALKSQNGEAREAAQ